MVQRATSYFRDRIDVTDLSDALVKDYRMLSVALSAFGLEDDIANKAFIKKVLESDLDDDSSLANRLSDKRYLRLAQAFDFLKEGRSDHGELGAQVTAAYEQREFERRIGETDEDIRLALSAQRELSEFDTRQASNNTLWYDVLASKPLRAIFEGAFGLATSHGQLPIDRQFDEFTKASERILGSSLFTEILKPDRLDKLVNTYLVRSKISIDKVTMRYSSALIILGSGPINRLEAARLG